ncbi:MAG: hypothetical protein KDI88_00590 [Gammaproteobacteria bacterium]|nr:hypothetical protein [Gammaproteobacteria bacterium]
MLKSRETSMLLLRFGGRIWVCMHQKHLDEGLRARIKPWTIGAFACWMDTQDKAA